MSLNQLVVAKLTAQLNSLIGQPIALILQAFLEVREGCSADRVIADPDMDRRFLQRCRELGLSGTDFELNWKLFNARKDKFLANCPETRRYTVSSDRRDEFEFASEIAVRYVQQMNQYVSLDKIICDPELANAFDDAAGRLAPGFASLEYRWVALGLRKAHRLTPATLDVKHPEFELLGTTEAVRLSEIPKSEGIYLFRSEADAIFIGETQNLHHRIERHFEFSASHGLPEWLYNSYKPMLLGIRPLPDVKLTTRKMMELNAIRVLKPLFNYYMDPQPCAA